jgi:hypothetical protein
LAIGQTAIAIFGVLAIASRPVLSPAQEPAVAVRAGEHRIPLTVRDGAVYIHARVNGNRALLLLDTGAVLTTFSLMLVPTQQTDSRITVTMAKGSIVAFRVLGMVADRGENNQPDNRENKSPSHSHTRIRHRNSRILKTLVEL